MSFVDFSRIGSARPDLNRHQKFSVASVDIKEKSDPYNFYSESDLTPIKPSGTPNAKALKWFGIVLGVVVSVAVIVTLIVCLVVFLGHGHNNDDNSKGRTTLRYQKDKHSSTPPPPPPTMTESNSPSASSTTPTTTTVPTTTTTTAKANGTWSNWGPWTMCAVTCGNSVHSRYRTCIKNTVNDTNCVGNFKEEQECTTTPCPVYGTWTTWQSWSNCDATCGGGTQNRLRTCEKVQNTDIDCVGRSTQQQTCSEWACPDCSRVCTTGTLNSVCDACECSTNVHGIVRNQNGGLLNNASVAHESAPYRELTFTNENGTFELNNVCNQKNIILKRSGYQDTSMKITSSSVTVIMQLIQYPMITTQPKSHLRLEGESVEFCCNATGNPEVTSYEWLKNGNLLNESFYPNGTTLIMTDLRFADDGKVVCRANSPVGAIYSDSVSLSVRANPDDFCSDAYGPHEINLPSDCIQPDTNSVKYDIGMCSPKDCRKNDSNGEQGCSVDKKYCCIPNKRERRIIQCTGYTFPLYVITSCGCGECEETDITIRGQAVGATSGLPLQLGTVEIDGNSVGSTGFFGDFMFTVPRGTTRIAVKFKDTYFNNFLDTLKIIRLNEEIFGSFSFHVAMIEKAAPIIIDSSVPNTLQLGNENGAESIASLNIPPNSIFYPNGTQYNGSVSASLNFFDPRNSSSLQNAPGEFVTNDQEGETQSLQSFGVFSLSLNDQSGSRLNLVGETEIRLDRAYFETSALGNSSDAKLWGLNPETGIWEEQGTLTVLSSKRRKRRTGFLVGSIQLNAYRWWNIDKIAGVDRCYFKTRVFEGGNEINQDIQYKVRVIVDQSSGSNVAFTEQFVKSDYRIWTMCKQEATLKGYIQVEVNGKMIHIDKDNQALSDFAIQDITYRPLDDDRTVFANMIASDSGPFYTSPSANVPNKFHFKIQNDDFSLFSLPPRPWMIHFFAKDPGNLVWYPPLNSIAVEQLRYRTCFIKIGAENANENLVFRVTSLNEELTSTGIQEKRLINGATCIEYRCSVRNPDFSKTHNNIFDITEIKYTIVRVMPIGQVCSVAIENSDIRSAEQRNMLLSSQKTDVGKIVFEANIPESSEGLYFEQTPHYNKIENDGRDNAIKKCNSGISNRHSDDMDPNTGLAVKFQCL